MDKTLIKLEVTFSSSPPGLKTSLKDLFHSHEGHVQRNSDDTTFLVVYVHEEKVCNFIESLTILPYNVVTLSKASKVTGNPHEKGFKILETDESRREPSSGNYDYSSRPMSSSLVLSPFKQTTYDTLRLNATKTERLNLHLITDTLPVSIVAPSVQKINVKYSGFKRPGGMERLFNFDLERLNLHKVSMYEIAEYIISSPPTKQKKRMEEKNNYYFLDLDTDCIVSALKTDGSYELLEDE